MPNLRVDFITNKFDDAAPILSVGATVSSGYALTSPNMNITGILTATSFVGNGSQLTNLSNISAAKARALKSILIFDEYRL
jgi:hypothetical protein